MKIAIIGNGNVGSALERGRQAFSDPRDDPRVAGS